jgi:hypothetical protein
MESISYKEGKYATDIYNIRVCIFHGTTILCYSGKLDLNKMIVKNLNKAKHLVHNAVYKFRLLNLEAKVTSMV